jgi:hypothetical protein
LYWGTAAENIQDSDFQKIATDAAAKAHAEIYERRKEAYREAPYLCGHGQTPLTYDQTIGRFGKNNQRRFCNKSCSTSFRWSMRKLGADYSVGQKRVIAA